MGLTILEGLIWGSPVKIELGDCTTHKAGREHACMQLQKLDSFAFHVERKTCDKKETCFYVIREGEERSQEDLDFLQDPKDYKVCDFHPNGFYKMIEGGSE